MANDKLKYKRILLKLSGEAFLGERQFGIDPKFLERISNEIKEVYDLGVQLAIVVGAGNIFRGRDAEDSGINSTTGDYLGMLGTVMNSLALRDSLLNQKLDVRLMSALEMPQICEPYIRERAIYQLEKKRIVIIGAGTGNPHFSTDTAAALRALELKCDILFKATKVDGVFDRDPKIDKDAVHHATISHHQVIVDDLKVMDGTALSLCRENHMPVLVFNIMVHNNIKRAVLGEGIGSLIKP